MSDSIPQSLTAGESLSLSFSFDAYPAMAGWALRWVIQGSGITRVTVEGAVSGEGFTLDLASSESAKLLGACPWQLWISKDTRSVIVGAGVLDVAPSAAVVSYDEQVLASLEAALLRLAADDEAEVEIDNRKMVFKDPEKVQRLISVYRNRIRIARGGQPFTRIPVRIQL